MKYKLCKVALKSYQNNEKYCSCRNSMILECKYHGDGYAIVDEQDGKATILRNLKVYPILRKNEYNQILEDEDVEENKVYATDLRGIGSLRKVLKKKRYSIR